MAFQWSAMPLKYTIALLPLFAAIALAVLAWAVKLTQLSFVLEQPVVFLRNPGQLLIFLTFLLQVSGLTDHTKAEIDGMYRFMFAGPDAIMSEAETARKQEMQTALVKHAVYFHGGYGLLWYLSFDAYDLQKLVFCDKEVMIEDVDETKELDDDKD